MTDSVKKEKGASIPASKGDQFSTYGSCRINLGTSLESLIQEWLGSEIRRDVETINEDILGRKRYVVIDESVYEGETGYEVEEGKIPVVDIETDKIGVLDRGWIDEYTYWGNSGENMFEELLGTSGPSRLLLFLSKYKNSISPDQKRMVSESELDHGLYERTQNLVEKGESFGVDLSKKEREEVTSLRDSYLELSLIMIAGLGNDESSQVFMSQAKRLDEKFGITDTSKPSRVWEEFLYTSLQEARKDAMDNSKFARVQAEHLTEFYDIEKEPALSNVISYFKDLSKAKLGIGSYDTSRFAENQAEHLSLYFGLKDTPNND